MRGVSESGLDLDCNKMRNQVFFCDGILSGSGGVAPLFKIKGMSR